MFKVPKNLWCATKSPVTTGMTLMFLMFYILLISLFSSWCFSIFAFLFLPNLMSPGIRILIMALLSFLFTATMSASLGLISLSQWIITSQKIFTSPFSTTPSGTCLYHFSLFSGCISHTISNEIFLKHPAFSCTPFVLTFHIRSQYQINFHFSCHTFYKVVIGLFYLSCVSHSLFKYLFLHSAQHGLPFNFQVTFS